MTPSSTEFCWLRSTKHFACITKNFRLSFLTSRKSASTKVQNWGKNWRHDFNVSIPQNRQLARQKQSHLQPETTKNSILAAAFCLLMKDNANEFDDDHKTHECHCLETTCHTKSWPAKVKVSPPSGLFKNKQSAFKLLSWQESYYWISSSMCLIVSRSWLADVMLTRWSLEFGISIELCIGIRGLVAFDFDRIRSLRSSWRWSRQHATWTSVEILLYNVCT